MTRARRTSIDILEEAVSLLRSSTLDIAATYLAGAVPFTLGFLFFLADMSRSPYAFERLPYESLALAALFIWKNCWQAVFMAKLYYSVSPSEARAIHPWQAILTQATLQPLSLLIPLPLPWITAFFRNAALYAALGRPDALAAARQQAVYDTRQNWGVLTIVAACSVVLFANVMATIVFIPQIGRSFLGIEGDLALAGVHIVNLTTASVAAAMTWLAVDPLLDAVYVLRCFYGESVASGADLLAAFKRAAALVAIVIFTFTSAHAQSTPSQSINEKQLDRAIDQVVHQREFTWRSPHPEGEAPQWYQSAVKMVRETWDLITRKLEEWFTPARETRAAGNESPVSRKTILALTAVIVALITAGLILFFMKRKPPAVVVAQAVAAAAPVNLADESITADRLPEAEWLALANQSMANGEFRLALRAMYLAALNFLSARELVSIRRWKSGLDYSRELTRRSGSRANLPPLFNRSLAIFERGWYGRHDVDRAMAESLADGLSEMRLHAK